MLQRLSMATHGTDVASLQAIAVNKVVESLGEQAKTVANRFCCGNTLSSPDRVKLAYESRGDTNTWTSMTFPGAESTAVQQLRSVCAVANFGKEGMGKRCGSFVLDPERFLTSFQLCDTRILDEIQQVMLPDTHDSVRAELHALCVYGGLRGRRRRCKTHENAPQSSQVLGSLVVCLPTQFTGGALVARHLGREVRFDWSSPPQNPAQRVSWAAFFRDVEHEVLPVTQGYRVTLSYNLYSVDLQQDMRSALITTSPFYHELRAAASNPHFLRDGGVLGFRCQNQYVFEDLDNTRDLPHLLKGADSIVYAAAKSLGLPVIVKPVTGDFGVFEQRRYVLPAFSNGSCDDRAPLRILKRCKEMRFKTVFGRVHRDEHITWCQELTNLQPTPFMTRPKPRARARASFRVKPCFIIRQAACILVGVPKWGKRQTLGTREEDDTAPRSKRKRAAAPKNRKKKCTETEFGGPDMEVLLGGPEWEELAAGPKRKKMKRMGTGFGGSDTEELSDPDWGKHLE